MKRQPMFPSPETLRIDGPSRPARSLATSLSMIAVQVPQHDGGTLIALAVVLLGEGVIHLTERMTALRDRIHYWAVGWGIVMGFAFFISALAAERRTSTDELKKANPMTM